MPRKTLNLGILAHVDAGKTTLTERLLFTSGVIDRPGSVDAGTTLTDSLPLERRRGITIKSAVASFPIGDIDANLIDTPGHPDFIAEVDRVLSVLDGVVLVVSAVEGVQPQTRILMRSLERLRMPALLFVNKIDRAGARPGGVVDEIARRLTGAVIAMGRVDAAGTRGARFVAAVPDDAGFTAGLAELLAERDDGLLAAYLRDEAGLPYARLRAALAAQTRRAQVHPVFFGSAITGAGIEQLMGGIAELLPASAGDPDGPVSGSIFKIERGGSGEKVAYVRMFSGTVSVRDRLRFGAGLEGRVTAIAVFDRGSAVRRQSVRAGQIGKLWGLAGTRIADPIGEPARRDAEHQFPPPTLESAVVPCDPGERQRLRAALGQLAEQDPLINLRQDDERQEIYVSLYGEVQKEVIGAVLADDFGLAVTFCETTTIYIERPAGASSALEVLTSDDHPYSATVGLRVEPGPAGSGLEFRLDVQPAAPAPVHLQDRGQLQPRHDAVHRARARPGPARLAGHRLHRHDEQVRLLHRRRPDQAPAAHPQDHGRRLPQTDATGPDESAGPGLARSSASPWPASASRSRRPEPAPCWPAWPGSAPTWTRRCRKVTCRSSRPRCRRPG